MREGEPGESDLAARARRRVESGRGDSGLGDIVGGLGVGIGLNVMIQTAVGFLCWVSFSGFVKLVSWMPVTQLLYLAPLATWSWRRKNREVALGLAFAALLTLFIAATCLHYLQQS